MQLKIIAKKLVTGMGRKILLAFFVRGLGAVAGLLMSFMVARSLNVEETGLFFLALTICFVFAAISSLGMNHSLLRFIGAAAAGQNWNEVNSVYRFAIQYGGLSAIICASILWGTADNIALLLEKPNIASVLRAIAPAIIGLTLFSFHAQALQALHETLRSILILNILTPICVCFFLIIFQLNYSGFVSIVHAEFTVYLYVISTGITLIFALWFWWRHEWSVWPKKISHHLWKSCIPLWVVVISGQIVTWGGLLVAGYYVSASEIAYLAVAQRLSILVSFILIVINVVMAPIYAALWQQKKLHQLAKQAKKASWLIIALSLPTVIIVFIFASEVLFIFGKDYINAVALLRILLVGQFINALTGSVGYLLMMSGHEKDFRNTTVLFGIIGLLLSLCVIPRYGVTGAACSTAIVIALQNIMALILVKRRLGFWVISL